MPYEISTFYHFFSLPEAALPSHKTALLEAMQARGVCGTIVLAAEGLNATLCAPPEALQAFIRELEAACAISVTQTRSPAPYAAFGKAKVRIKPALVKLGTPLAPDQERGDYLEAESWDALIGRPDVAVIDARNRYETYLGRFRGAIVPGTRNFHQLPQIDPASYGITPETPIATYCTGGIRCEKYTAWLKANGYRHVYHLRGGILGYFKQRGGAAPLWEGSCYVFDDRVAVTPALIPDESVASCPGCGHSLEASDLRHEAYIPGQACRHCATHPPSNSGAWPAAYAAA